MPKLSKQGNSITPLESTEGAAFITGLLCDGKSPIRGKKFFSTASDQYLLNLTKTSSNRHIAPVLYYLLKTLKIDISTNVSSFLEQLYAGWMQRFFHLDDQCSKILSLLDKNGIHSRVIKGTDLAKRLYPYPELRTFLDIDLLMSKEDSIKAGELLCTMGWKRELSVYMHDRYRKDDITLELHRTLFGRTEAALYCFSESDAMRYRDGKMSAEEEFVLLCMKFYAESTVSKGKILDLYLFSNISDLNPEAVRVAYTKWNARFPVSVIRSMLRFYTPGRNRFLSQFRLSSFWRFPLLWSLCKYPFLLISIRGSFKKALSPLLNRPDLYPDEHTTIGRRLYHMLHFFFGYHSLRKRKVTK